MKQKLTPQEIKEQINGLARKMLDWYRSTIKELQSSWKEAEKLARKKPQELTGDDCNNLQYELQFLMESLGDEDNYEEIGELITKLEEL